MIKDKKQFDRFLTLLPDLEKDQVYFVSLSARNKYLTREERDFYSLGRTEMFGREIAFSKEDLEKKITKNLVARWEIRTTNNGKEIPEKCLVTYVNINPCSTIKAYQLFSSEMDKEMVRIYNSLLKNNEPNFDAMNRIQSKLLNCIQKSSAEKSLIDIDADVTSISKISDILTGLKDAKVTFNLVQTQGGFHILVKKDTLPEKFKLHELINKAHCELFAGEIKFNSNAMVPVPGTLQAGKLVTLL